jgi:hypothetical protein
MKGIRAHWECSPRDLKRSETEVIFLLVIGHWSLVIGAGELKVGRLKVRKITFNLLIFQLATFFRHMTNDKIPGFKAS